MPTSAGPDANPLGPSPGTKPTTWSPAVFAAIEWRRFEALCEALFAQAGFDTRAQSHGADGGVDIWLQSRHAPGQPVIVQCKHWQGRQVPVSAVREFLGVMASHKLQRGTYATSSTFTREALAFAQANGINAQDGAGLLRLIAQRTPQQQAALLAVALDGEYWRPTCASCGVKMVERTGKASGERFWGCSGYPKCRGTQSMTQATQARLAS
ncbi:restriction endonuclease [Ottowia flava]|uniref:Restriction endonuclease n=1 Tax=Ottowia flava TaxID=2675430 RepID=A0ABW4KVB0_9BURK|nr:restriction endonuclease [Ottowia sp. GY511]